MGCAHPRSSDPNSLFLSHKDSLATIPFVTRSHQTLASARIASARLPTAPPALLPSRTDASPHPRHPQTARKHFFLFLALPFLSCSSPSHFLYHNYASVRDGVSYSLVTRRLAIIHVALNPQGRNFFLFHAIPLLPCSSPFHFLYRHYASARDNAASVPFQQRAFQSIFDPSSNAPSVVAHSHSITSQSIEESNVEIASIQPDSDAIPWYDWYKTYHGISLLERLKIGLLICFRPYEYENVDGQLTKIRHTSTVQEYIADLKDYQIELEIGLNDT
ncbi:hypothetical protein BHE74_00018596 [Ensete ventricosum]|nr:hypothetical protein BHE74_00018596 [Ensete ventricosum]